MIFVRHGQSTDNVAGVFGNRPPGAGLSPQGREQAAGLRMAGITAAHASTASRAVETAGLISGLSVRTHAGLLEYDFGVHEGSADPAVGLLARDVLHAWVIDGEMDARLEGGESGAEVASRFRTAVETIASADGAGENVLVVSHTGTLTIGLLDLCINLTPADVWGTALPHATPIVVDHTADGWLCRSWPTAR